MNDRVTQLHSTYLFRRAVQRSFHDQHCKGARQARHARRVAFRRYYQALQASRQPAWVIGETAFRLPAEAGRTLAEYAYLLAFTTLVVMAALVLLSDWVLKLWTQVEPLITVLGGR